jgi:hypothetical protein
LGFGLGANGVAQGINGIGGGEYGEALVGYNGEEVGASGDIGAAVFHEMIIAFGVDVGFRAGLFWRCAQRGVAINPTYE